MIKFFCLVDARKIEDNDANMPNVLIFWESINVIFYNLLGAWEIKTNTTFKDALKNKKNVQHKVEQQPSIRMISSHKKSFSWSTGNSGGKDGGDQGRWGNQWGQGATQGGWRNVGNGLGGNGNSWQWGFGGGQGGGKGGSFEGNGGADGDEGGRMGGAGRQQGGGVSGGAGYGGIGEAQGGGKVGGQGGKFATWYGLYGYGEDRRQSKLNK